MSIQDRSFILQQWTDDVRSLETAERVLQRAIEQVNGYMGEALTPDRVPDPNGEWRARLEKLLATLHGRIN